MEEFRVTELTQTAERFNALGKVLLQDRELAGRLSAQALKDARVRHGIENQRAKPRKLTFKKKTKKGGTTAIRTLHPTSRRSLLLAFHELARIEERRQEEEWARGDRALTPEMFLDRVAEDIWIHGVSNKSFDTVVASLMVQHNYKQPEARHVYEFLKQDPSTPKSDNKFYTRRGEIESSLKVRFSGTPAFEITPDKKAIQMQPATPSQAQRVHDLLGLYASVLGEPFFTESFKPKDSFPALATNGVDYEKENDTEHRRIEAIANPSSCSILLESLGYMKMREKVQVPILNSARFPGNGDSKPLLLEEAKSTTAEINTIVNDFVGSLNLRRCLKHPLLRVVVDGKPLSGPFAAQSAWSRPFNLSKLARYIQVFAIENGVEEIVSTLSLAETEIAEGQAWHSRLQLEGNQEVQLNVQPIMDEEGKLTGSILVVEYRPAILDLIKERLTQRIVRKVSLNPSWAKVALFAPLIAVFSLLPLYMLNVFSWPAALVLVAAISCFLLIAGKLSSLGKWLRPQQVALDGFVASVLIVMLTLGILPYGPMPDSTLGIEQSGKTHPKSISLVLDSSGSAPNLHRYRLFSFANDRDVSNVSSFDFGLTYLGSRSTALTTGGDNVNAATYGLLWASNFKWRDNRSASATWPVYGDLATAQQSADLSIGAQVNPGTTNSVAERTAKVFRIRKRSERPLIVEVTYQLEVIVSTTEMITLLDSHSLIASDLAQRNSATPSPVNDKVASSSEVPHVAAEKPVSDSALSQTSATSAASQDIGASDRNAPVKAAAIVVFRSPTKLNSLNKGDYVNANFKSSPLDTINQSERVLDCRAEGVVQDIKHTDAKGLEIRVCLNLTFVRDGATVSRSMDLLLTDASIQPTNSHFGVLQASEKPPVETSRSEKVTK
jgi:hypothetical protein